MSEEPHTDEMNPSLEEKNGLPVLEPVKPKRRWWLQILLSFVILICGIAIGSAVTLNVVWKRFVEGFQRPEEIPMRFLGRMKWDLDLTPKQEQEIVKFFREHHQKIREIREEYQPIIRAEMDDLRDKVESVLTEEQMEIWNTRFNRFEKLWMGKRPPGPPPGRGEGGGRGYRGGRGPDETGPDRDGHRGGDSWQEGRPDRDL